MAPDEAHSGPDRPAARRYVVIRRVVKILLWVLGSVVALLLLVAGSLYIPAVQEVVRGRAVSFLENKIGTPVRLERIVLRFPLGVALHGLYVEDQHSDTLVCAGTLHARASFSALMDRRIELGSVQLRDVRASIQQGADSTFNFDYILAALKGAPSAEDIPKDSTAGWAFSVGSVELENIALELELVPSGLGLTLRLGSLSADFDRFELDPLRFHIGALAVNDTRVDLRITPGPEKPDTYPLLVNPLADLDARIKTLRLAEVHFTLKNEVKGDSLWIGVEKGEIDVDRIDFQEQRFAFDRLMLERPEFGMLSMRGDPIVDTLRIDPPWLDQHDGFRFFTRDRKVSIKRVAVHGGALAMYTDHVRVPSRVFDATRMVFSQVEVDLLEVKFSNEKLGADVRSLSAKGAPSDDRVELSVVLEATPQAIDLRQGRLVVSGNGIGFTASAWPGDLSNAYRAPKDVPLKAGIRANLDPVALRPLLKMFALDTLLPANITERWNTEVAFTGTLARIDTARLDMVGDQGSVIHLSGNATELASWPNANMDLELRELTLGDGFRQVLSANVAAGTVLPHDLTAHLRASKRNGAISTTLNVRTELGNMKGTASASGWSARFPDNIAADLEVRDFAAYRFTGDTSMGRASLRLVAKATSLNSSTRSGSIAVEPERLHFHGQDLSSLTLTGEVQGDSIRVAAGIDSDALAATLVAKGLWPGSRDSLSASVRVDVEHAELQRLGLMDHVLNVDGSFAANAAFDTSGQGHFDLKADSMRLSNNERAFRFEHFLASAFLASDSTAFNLNSDALTLRYRSNVALDSLVPLAREKISSYFQVDSAFAPEPGKFLDLAITLPKSDPFTGLIVPDLSTIMLEKFTAYYDGDKDALKLEVAVPELAYRQSHIKDLLVSVDAVGNTLSAALSVERADYDSLFLEGLSITSKTRQGGLETTLRVQHADDPPRYQLGVRLTREGEGAAIHMIPEGLVLNSAVWTADPQNMIRFLPTGPESEHFTMSGDGQEVEMTTSARDTHLAFDQFRLATLLGLIQTGDSTPFVEGELTGAVELPGRTNRGLKADLRLAGLAVLGHTLGDLHLAAQEPMPKHYAATVKLLSGTNTLEATANIDVSGATPAVDATAALSFSDIAFLEPFAGAFLYELGGGLRGDLRFAHKQGASSLEGTLAFRDARVGVKATGTLLYLRDETARFDRQGIHLDGFTLRDSLGNSFTLDGGILTTDFRELRFDLELRTDAFQLARNRAGGLELFHGDVFARLDLDVTGTSDLPVVKGDIGVLEKTDLSIILPGSRVSLVSSEGVVVFTDDHALTDSGMVATDSEMLRDSLKARLKGVELDLGIHVDKRAAFTVVLDPTTGDAATFKGEGDLRFRYNAKGDMYLSGPFTLAEGGYTLEFYGLVKKRFELVDGSTVVWDGDPLAAALGIKARYRSESAAYPLVAGSSSLSQAEQNRLQQRLPFDVIISVDGKVSKPEIDFAIDLERSYRNSYPLVSSRLDQLAGSASRDERAKQVFGLLVLNSFIQDEASGGAPSSGIATSAARNSVNGILTDQMNKLTGKYVKGVDISLGVNTVDQAEGNSTYQRTSVDYKVSKSFLDKRLSFEVGGSVGVDEQQQRTGNVSSTRAAQYVVYYDLTRNGRFRLRGFYENAFDLYDGTITDSGVALMYTRDFEENERARTVARDAENARRQQEAVRKRQERDAREAAPTKP